LKLFKTYINNILITYCILIHHKHKFYFDITKFLIMEKKLEFYTYINWKTNHTRKKEKMDIYKFQILKYLQGQPNLHFQEQNF